TDLKPVVLIARPRSGTTALRGMLGCHPKVIALGEVFHEDYVEDPQCYYHFSLEKLTNNPALALPTPSNRSTLFTQYIKQLTQHFNHVALGKELFCLGINYNSLHSMNTFFQNSYDAPFLVQIIKRNSYHVVHLIRRNVLQAAISEMRAKAT